jgi:hypothetical protein
MSMSKKAQDKLVESIYKVRKQPSNKVCFTCHAKGPPNLIPALGIFVCFQCAGIHREFNHRVKSISASAFKPDEVALTLQGGNKCATELYLANLSAANRASLLPSPEDPQAVKQAKVRDFIRSAFVHEEWKLGNESKEMKRERRRAQRRQSSVASQDGNQFEDEGSMKKERKKKKKKNKRRESSVAEEEGGGNADFEVDFAAHSPTLQQQQQQSTSAAPAANDQSLDFDSMFSFNTPAPASNNNPADDFSSFQSASSTQDVSSTLQNAIKQSKPVDINALFGDSTPSLMPHQQQQQQQNTFSPVMQQQFSPMQSQQTFDFTVRDTNAPQQHSPSSFDPNTGQPMQQASNDAFGDVFGKPQNQPISLMSSPQKQQQPMRPQQQQQQQFSPQQQQINPQMLQQQFAQMQQMMQQQMTPQQRMQMQQMMQMNMGMMNMGMNNISGMGQMNGANMGQSQPQQQQPQQQQQQPKTTSTAFDDLLNF